jgi:OmpA-OmpF porin, OOP family
MLIHMKKLSGILLALPILGACANYDMDTVGNMEIDSWAFAESLHGQYMRIGRDEAAEDDWKDALFFRDKAREAAEAANEGAALPEPQMVGDRDIPEGALADLNAAYDSLMAALSDGRRTKPTAAAIAQTSFDCWLQEQEEDVQPDDIALCREDFEDALALLTKVGEPMVAAAPESVVKPEQRTFVVYFDHNSATLDVLANMAIQNALERAKSTNPKFVQVGGHTDTTGDQVYNDALSDRRAKAVAKKLIEGGLMKKNLIQTSMFGENFTTVKTGDNVKNRSNRRVEIKLSY